MLFLKLGFKVGMSKDSSNRARQHERESNPQIKRCSVQPTLHNDMTVIFKGSYEHCAQMEQHLINYCFFEKMNFLNDFEKEEMCDEVFKFTMNKHSRLFVIADEEKSLSANVYFSVFDYYEEGNQIELMKQYSF